jgi:hypothetical protein
MSLRRACALLALLSCAAQGDTSVLGARRALAAPEARRVASASRTMQVTHALRSGVRDAQSALFPSSLDSSACLVDAGRDDGSPDSLRATLQDSRCAIITLAAGCGSSPAVRTLTLRAPLSNIVPRKLSG